MAQPMPALRIIAQPKLSYRPRYRSEGRRSCNRFRRLVRAAENTDVCPYPTIEVNIRSSSFL